MLPVKMFHSKLFIAVNYCGCLEGRMGGKNDIVEGDGRGTHEGWF